MGRMRKVLSRDPAEESLPRFGSVVAFEMSRELDVGPEICLARHKPKRSVTRRLQRFAFSEHPATDRSYDRNQPLRAGRTKR